MFLLLFFYCCISLFNYSRTDNCPLSCDSRLNLFPKYSHLSLVLLTHSPSSPQVECGLYTFTKRSIAFFERLGFTGKRNLLTCSLALVCDLLFCPICVSLLHPLTPACANVSVFVD